MQQIQEPYLGNMEHMRNAIEAFRHDFDIEANAENVEVNPRCRRGFELYRTFYKLILCLLVVFQTNKWLYCQMYPDNTSFFLKLTRILTFYLHLEQHLWTSQIQKKKQTMLKISSQQNLSNFGALQLPRSKKDSCCLVRCTSR